MITFTIGEIEMMKENPDVLRALANEHDCMEAEGEAMGCDCTMNAARSRELIQLAEEIEASI